jgi:hypothetical protein
VAPLNPTRFERTIASNGGTVPLGHRDLLLHPYAEMRTIAGMPLVAAAAYTVLFAMALWCYPAWWREAPVLQPDSWSYMRAAQDLADFRLDSLQVRPPGYPLLLLLTGASESPSRALLLVSLMLHCMTIWVLASVLHRVGLSQVMLILFGIVLLLPPYTEAAGRVLAENLAEGALAVAFFGVSRWILDKERAWLVLGGVAIAFAALVHPTHQLLAVAISGCLALGACFWRPRPHWKTVGFDSLLLIVTSLLVVGAYASANYARFGHFAVGHKLGLVLSTKTFAFVERLPDEYAPVRAALIHARNEAVAAGGWHDAADSIHLALPELARVTGLQEPELSDYLLRVNWTLITKAPLSYVREVATAFAVYWLPTSGPLANFDSRALQLAWAAVHFGLMTAFVFTLAVVSGAGVLLYLGGSQRRRRLEQIAGASELYNVERLLWIFALACTIVFYTAVISSVFEIGIPRYRLPTEALIVCLVFVGGEMTRRLAGLLDASPLPG